MAFPNLTVKSGGTFTSEATGVPANGNNTFDINIDPTVIDDSNWFTFHVIALGASVLNATNPVVSADKTQVTINFLQTGGDSAKVIAEFVHSEHR